MPLRKYKIREGTPVYRDKDGMMVCCVEGVGWVPIGECEFVTPSRDVTHNKRKVSSMKEFWIVAQVRPAVCGALLQIVGDQCRSHKEACERALHTHKLEDKFHVVVLHTVGIAKNIVGIPVISETAIDRAEKIDTVDIDCRIVVEDE